MPITTTFKNFGHAIASGAKYLESAVVDALKYSAKVEQFQPEVDAIVGALAGPQYSAIADLGFHALGAVAQSLESVNTDAVSAVAANGVNVQLDVQTIGDIKSAVSLIKQILAAKGTPAPAATK